MGGEGRRGKDAEKLLIAVTVRLRQPCQFDQEKCVGAWVLVPLTSKHQYFFCLTEIFQIELSYQRYRIIFPLLCPDFLSRTDI